MDIAIIGGGISGLVLALALHQHSIKVTIYELRETADIANPGAIGLGPHALRILDKLGLYNEARDVSWPIHTMQLRDESDNLIADLLTGSEEHYGYDTLRIVRRRLHDILLAAIHSRGVPIISGKKYSHITSTTADSVTFTFTDNTTVTSNILVGADGIHSTVRAHIFPNIRPEYKGNLTMVAKLETNPLLTLPPSPSLTARLHSICMTQGKSAAFLAISQSSDGHEVAVAIDRPYPDLASRAEWDALLNDKQRQYDLFMEDLASWPSIVQLQMREVTVEDMYRSWPFYAIPDLETWSSTDRNVIVLGDAAHAIPPSAGQGAAMAIEDAWALGLVLGQCTSEGMLAGGGKGYTGKIEEWQDERRRRVADIRNLTKQMGNTRLPKEHREVLEHGDTFVASGQGDDLSWVYKYDWKPEGYQDRIGK